MESLQGVLPYMGAALTVYAAIRKDLSVLIQQVMSHAQTLKNHDDRLTKLEGKHHGNTQAQST